MSNVQRIAPSGKEGRSAFRTSLRKARDLDRVDRRRIEHQTASGAMLLRKLCPEDCRLARCEIWYVRRPSRLEETRQPGPNHIPADTRVRSKPRKRDGDKSRFLRELRRLRRNPPPWGR